MSGLEHGAKEEKGAGATGAIGIPVQNDTTSEILAHLGKELGQARSAVRGGVG
jgi:hypothetical protein